MNVRKIIIISVIVLCVGALAVGVYFGWKNARSVFAPTSTAPSNGEAASIGISSSSEAIQAAAKKLQAISDKPIFDYWIFNNASTSESGVFYLTSSGGIFKIKDGTSDEAITSGSISDIQAIESSSDGSRVLIESGSLSAPKFVIFNTAAKVFELMPANISAADFSPDAKSITYLEMPTSTALSNLVVKDFGTKPKTSKILSFGQKDFDLDWISTNQIILAPKPSAFYSASAWSVDVKNKTITLLADSLNGLMLKWSALGQIGLEFSSQIQGTEPKLKLVDNKGSIKANLDFTTLPSKCLVSEPQIYCAIPKDIPNRTALPDDYLKRVVYFTDAFYQININENSSLKIFEPVDLAIDAYNLNLIDGKLLFVNRYDNKLYSLEL